MKSQNQSHTPLHHQASVVLGEPKRAGFKKCKVQFPANTAYSHLQSHSHKHLPSKCIEETPIDECLYDGDFAKSAVIPLNLYNTQDEDDVMMEYEEKIEKLGFQLESELDFIYKNFKEIKEKSEIFKSVNYISSKKILALDLDETLIHSSTQYSSITDSHICSCYSKHGLIYFKKRPYLDEFFQDASKYYNIIIFTASEKSYAEAIIAKIDTKSLITQVFTSDSCTFINGKPVKNLKIITENLSKVVIVDNILSSFAMQLSNGICIRSYKGESGDKELISMKIKLQILCNFSDLRIGLKNAYDYDKLYQMYTQIYKDDSKN